MPTSTLDALRQATIPGGWAEKFIHCADRSWNVLLPGDADAFLDQLAEIGDGVEPDVFWAQVWPSALYLGRLLLESSGLAEKSVLELGCGIGLSGLAALAAGARVTFSDYVPIAVELAVANAHRNGYDQAAGIVLDWKVPLNHRFHWIIASDILYDRTKHESLINVIDRMLDHDGEVWIGDAGRYHAGEFIELAWSRGYDVELRDEFGMRLDATTSGKFQLLQLRPMA